MMFADSTVFAGIGDIEKVPGDGVTCALAGAGVMHKVDSGKKMD